MTKFSPYKTSDEGLLEKLAQLRAEVQGTEILYPMVPIHVRGAKIRPSNPPSETLSTIPTIAYPQVLGTADSFR